MTSNNSKINSKISNQPESKKLIELRSTISGNGNVKEHTLKLFYLNKTC